MGTFAGVWRSIDPRIIGLLRRSLTIAGLLFGFFVAGSTLAHAQDRTPPQPHNPASLVGSLGLPDLPPLDPVTQPIRKVTKPLQPITSPITRSVVAPVVQPITKAVAPVTAIATQTLGAVTKTLAPLTNTLTSITTGVTTTVVRTVDPVVKPAVGVTAPVVTPILYPVLPPPPGGWQPPGQTFGGTPDPSVDTLASAATVVGPATALSPQPIAAQPFVALVPPAYALPAGTLDGGLADVGGPGVPPPDRSGGPIVDITTGANSGGGSGSGGPASGISCAVAGIGDNLWSSNGVRPGAGPPKWWLFDAHNHPS